MYTDPLALAADFLCCTANMEYLYGKKTKVSLKIKENEAKMFKQLNTAVDS